MNPSSPFPAFPTAPAGTPFVEPGIPEVVPPGTVEQEPGAAFTSTMPAAAIRGRPPHSTLLTGADT
jgi:hypothetical protein